jgi:Ca2+-binding RTX toxin-like protein
MLKLAVALFLTAALAAPALAQDDPCAAAKAGEQCGPGNGRHLPGGGDKVSHKGWPAITGVLWKVLDGGDHHFVGGPANDEILGLHGNDTLAGEGGNDVIWGDQSATVNPASQHDVLRGGDGNDFLYPSHGANTLLGGPGNDRIIAYYGHGTIDCGPGDKDYVQTRENGAYKVKNCEIVRHFCAYGSKPNGDCKKPGEKSSLRGRRT